MTLWIFVFLSALWGLPLQAQKKFDHSVTGFPLRGEHDRIACQDCHKQSPAVLAKGPGSFQWAGLRKDCYPCHADYHGYGKEVSVKQGPLLKCDTCHNDIKWKDSLRFDHNTQTIFPVTGKHKENKCFECHRPTTAPQTFKGEQGHKVLGKDGDLRRYAFPDLPKKSCATCHVTPHPASFHQKFKGVTCEKCHTTDGWKIMSLQGQIQSDRSFHDKTRFPLTGKHKVTNCKQCHVKDGNEVFKFPNADRDFCVTCHASVHKKQFDEKFFNMSCAKCHSTTNFTQRTPFQHDITNFKIDGKHSKIEKNCEKCHVPTKDKLPTKPPKTAHKFDFDESKDEKYCVNCHQTVHKEQFHSEFQKKSCASCHTTSSFAKLSEFDHSITRFKLTGRHEEIGKQCSECHKPSNLTLPTKPPRKGGKFMFEGANRGFCEECHINEHKDMFHSKFYNKPCGVCHTTEKFPKLKEFDHEETDFELKGKHKQVKCTECHKDTDEKFRTPPKNFKGKYLFPEIPKRNCQTCHKDVHKGSNGPLCTKCHNESGWKNASEYHKDFLLTGVHLQLDCKACHVNERILQGSSQECSQCHHEDDPHNGQLMPCQDCHTQNFWEQTRFDHNLTRFPLRGAHRVTECRACHNQGVYQGLPTDCRGCHAGDAARVIAPSHAQPNYFQCEQCHTVYQFPGAVIR
ncbi:MAG TPA: hypothetical protein VFO10_01010 [Oligoflexus sp.]|uniref:cytochrome c3 family protein n=1 Tax=Oligoflexus sp. TaxID=1971216 RepID=UPI002D7F8B3E|nr:hypothetical protein [Oligoflexus sp.]HET9235795.1 hypothetical protein [Oligoflexus sp.]